MLLWLFLSAALGMVAFAQGSPKYFIVAPNVIRVDVNEKVLVSVHDTPDGVHIPMTLHFELPGKDEHIAVTPVNVAKDNPREVTMSVSTADLGYLQENKQTKPKFVTLVVTANAPQLSFQDRRAILMSYQSGFVFLQTDKPLYTPSQRVNILVVSLNQDMEPGNRQVQVDIVNPDGIIIDRFNKTPGKGFLPIQFDFPPLPKFGNWTVVAYYGYEKEAETSVQFEVKEYVLPKFSVDLTIIGDSYIVPDSEKIQVKVTGRYIFGEPVIGSYFVSFGVFEDDGSLTEFGGKQAELNDEGVGRYDFRMDDIPVDDWAVSLMGKRLLIQAFVTDQSTRETINTNNSAVIFSRTPYQINWDMTQKFFKKGLPFVGKANLKFMNGLPANDITVSMTAITYGEENTELNREVTNKRSDSKGDLDFLINVHAGAARLFIQVRTTMPKSNAVWTFDVQPQKSSDNEYMMLRVLDISEEKQIGHDITVDVQLTHLERATSLHYFVIAGGRIVHEGVRNQNHVINQNTGLTIEITHDMQPSARIVAYYFSRPSGNIIADAVLFEVEEKCKNPMDLKFKGLEKDRDTNTFETDGMKTRVELQVTANEGTSIGLMAIDEAVLTLRNYHRLNQKKVFKEMAMYDLGCGPGGGENTANVFKDAGVTVITNGQLSVERREVMGCPTAGRRRRRSLDKAGKEELENSFEGTERKYCQMGMREVKGKNITCAQRKKGLAARRRLDLGSPEMIIFEYCCKAVFEAETETEEDQSHGRSGNNNQNGVNLDKITVRSDFPESWFFETGLEIDDDGEVTFERTLPSSVTTWVIQAVGVSPNDGICVDEGVKLQVRPKFFLDLSLPFSVQRFEQIEIIGSVFYYSDRRGDDSSLQVNVHLKGVEGICSDAQPGTYSEAQTISVRSGTPTSLKFIIVPLVTGDLPIQIVATSGNYEYAIERILTVRPEGFEQIVVVRGTLDPQNTRASQRREEGRRDSSLHHNQYWADDGGESTQINTIVYELNSDAIPDTNNVHVSLKGDIMGSVVATVIGGLDKLLRIPSGCGEQTMLGLAPNVYVYTYLRETGLLTGQQEENARKYIRAGVQRELQYRKLDGSYAAFKSRTSSTWLTAFVAKVMCQAKQFGHVDDMITCSAMRWLITQTQTEDGSFRELLQVIHKEMSGGVQGKVSLTAFVLISLLECKCDGIAKDPSIDSAVVFLEQELAGLTRPYAIAITAYALAKAKRDSAEDAIDKLKEIEQNVYVEASDARYWRSDDSSFGGGAKPYWYTRRPKAIEVETTSYALLALLEMDDIQYTHAIVNWLTNQENYNGGFVSTQDTVVALQALSLYASKVQDNNVDIRCKVSCRETDFDETILMQRDDANVREHRALKIPEEDSKLTVFFNTRGSGLGEFKFVSTYYVPEPSNQQCDFELNITQTEDKGVVGNGKRITLKISTRYLGKEDATGMAIVDVGLYTGYEPVEADLKQLKDRSNGRIDRYETTDHTVIFYLDNIPKADPTVLVVHAESKFKVGKVQPVKVHVYDYYNPTLECVKFISPDPGSERLGTLCSGNTCVCAAGKCAQTSPTDNRNKFNHGILLEKACESSSHFAYEVVINSLQEKGSFTVYNVTIFTPIKLGLDTVMKQETRAFWKSSTCEEPALLEGKRYLFIGSRVLNTKDKKGEVMFKYIIDEKMTFYEWPSKRKVIKNPGKWQYLRDTLVKLRNGLIAGGCAT